MIDVARADVLRPNGCAGPDHAGRRLTAHECGTEKKPRRRRCVKQFGKLHGGHILLFIQRSGAEPSPNFGDGLRVQAAAVWDFEDSRLAATSVASVNLTP
jgi:hypothetical protein